MPLPPWRALMTSSPIFRTGYQTLLDHRFKDGHELSGGQWQRIAVARGFHREADLLICDEPPKLLPIDIGSCPRTL